MRRLIQTFVVLVLAGLATFTLSTPVGAVSLRANGDVTAAVNFACQIPRHGKGPCFGDHFVVPATRTVRVANVSSGGKQVKFYLYNREGHHLLGNTAWLNPGSGRKFIWRNDTGRTIKVEFEADAKGLTNVTCNARYYVS